MHSVTGVSFLHSADMSRFPASSHARVPGQTAVVSIDAEILPVSHVEELVRSIVKALRAFQMYLPNNPMYQRAELQLRDSFPPVWAVLDEITLFVRETDLIWEDHNVLRAALQERIVRVGTVQGRDARPDAPEGR